MEAYILDSILGSYAFSSDGGLIAYSHPPNDIDEAVHQALQLEGGELTPVLDRLLDLLKDKGFNKVFMEDESIVPKINKKGFSAEYVEGNALLVGKRAELFNLAVETGFLDSIEAVVDFMHKATSEYTRRKLRTHAQKRDLLAAQAIRATDDIDKTINLFVARLREWYSIHFPELDDLVEDHEKYVRIVSQLGSRDNITVDSLVKLGFNKGDAAKIADTAKKSIGADLSDFDIDAIQTLARITYELYQLRDNLAGYIASVMKEVAPNMTALVGALLGARLISIAGSLDRLARMPASTIQVLGAEKALFRALRTGGRPPKHGIIFQYPDIHKSPRWQRGKIARALASKLAIAAKIDAFTGRYVGDRLNDELRKRIEEIRTVYAKPPARKKEEEKPKPSRFPRKPRKGGHGRGRRRIKKGGRR
ncbi:MAG: C/D box methylation guide ribonucleoprotein complex aNOP56 subunit [Desulfurococcales archaeon]|nr:C/D box methylation guide ribonucleoprotein complex aNOP56 subunit [Desulfurococcales archaeon]